MMVKYWQGIENLLYEVIKNLKFKKQGKYLALLLSTVIKHIFFQNLSPLFYFLLAMKCGRNLLDISTKTMGQSSKFECYIIDMNFF